jgi:transglutaminase-like putative cysteine protease
VEVFLGDRWYLFDPSSGHSHGADALRYGRDAADVSFATIFGAVRAEPPKIVIEAVSDPLGGIELPVIVRKPCLR